MNNFKKSQKILLTLVLLLAVAITVLLVKQQQDLRQRATDTGLSATTACATNNTVVINVSFTNNSVSIVDVIAKDAQSGKEVALGAVNPGESATGTIETNLESLTQNAVMFETSTGESTNVTYNGLDCTSTTVACEVKEAKCSWDALADTTQYKVIVKDTDSGAVIKDDLVNHPGTSITFPAEAGKSYSCEVTPVNTCGEGQKASVEASCPAPTPTTVVPSATTTPTVNPSVTVTNTPVPPTNTPAPTETPRVTQPVATSTTSPSNPAATNTPVPTNVVKSKLSPTPTSIAALPPTGLSQDMLTITMIGTIIVLMGTFVVIFLW